MHVSVVIRTKNEARFIEETLKKVEEQEFIGDYEVIVVDSGSTDSTLDIVKRHEVRIVSIPEEEFNFSRALNMGASLSKGEFVVNLSAHATPCNLKWLQNLIAGFKHPNVAGTYGRQLSCGQVNPFDAFQNELYFGPKEVVFNAGDKTKLKRIHFSNSNSAIRKDIWKRCKFNEAVWGFEDILWQKQVTEGGFAIVYLPDAAVYHTHEVDIRDTYERSRNCAYTLAKMTDKRQSIVLVFYDAVLFLYLSSVALLQNVLYIWRNKHFRYLKAAPFFIMCQWLGWLVGRMKYRLRIV